MKKQVAVVALALGLSLVESAATAQEGFKVVDTITSASLRLIQSALPELTRYSLKLDGYRITVVQWNGHYGVLFKDLNAPPGCYGSCSRDKPAFEVELSEDGEVIRSHFSR